MSVTTELPLPALRAEHARSGAPAQTLADDLPAATGSGFVVHVMGTFPSDHLSRLGLQATHDVRCWRDDCKQRVPCIRCPLLGPRLE